VLETIGRVTVSVIESLKTHPGMLALAIMNLALLYLAWFEFNVLVHQQREVLALMTKCVDPEILKSLGLIK